MSTIDPLAARRERDARRPTTGQVLLTLLVIALLGAVTGFGVTRLDEGDEALSILFFALTFLGFAGVIIGQIVWTSLVMRRGDIGLAYGQAAALAGAGIAVALRAPTLDVWDVFTITGAILLGVALLLALLGWRAARSRARQAVREEELMRTGRLTSGTITDQGYDSFDEAANILTTVTVTFTDQWGTQRWVQQPALIRRSDPLRTGETTRLWYDPANPGDESSIVVEAVRQRTLRARR